MLAAEVAHWMALLPLTFLMVRAVNSDVNPAWFWLAGAFAVSWLADSWADMLPEPQRWVPSLVYPLAQSALVGAVLLSKRRAYLALALLTGLGLASAALFGAHGPDLLLRGVAWAGVVAIVAAHRGLPSRLRIALSVYFGLGCLAWVAFMGKQVVATWYAYQLVRLAGLVLFCDAASRPAELRVIRGKLTRVHLRARTA